MPDYTPVGNVDTLTATAAAAITGGQLLDCTADNSVQPSVGVLRPVGVALHDAPNGGRVTYAVMTGAMHETPIENTIVIAAGNPIVPSTVAGRVKTGTLATVAGAGTLIGVCIRGGTGNAGGTVLARWIGV